MTEIMKKYSLEDIDNISVDGFRIDLTNTINLNNIENICNDLTIPFEFRKYHHDNIFERRKNIVFQPKKQEEKKGIEKSIQDIQLILNKLTAQNYEHIYKDAIDIIDNLLNSNKVDELYKINKFIFECASQNKFNSETYAKFYKELINEYALLDGLIIKELNDYLDKFKDIKSCDAKENYAEFCKLNRINEKRRGLSSFITALVNNECIDISCIVDILVDLQNALKIELMKENNESTCQEISENLFILYKCNMIKDIEKELLKKLKSEVEEILKYNKKEVKSFNSKIKFKIMDINDQVLKKIEM